MSVSGASVLSSQRNSQFSDWTFQVGFSQTNTEQKYFPIINVNALKAGVIEH